MLTEQRMVLELEPGLVSRKLFNHLSEKRIRVRSQSLSFIGYQRIATPGILLRAEQNARCGYALVVRRSLSFLQSPRVPSDKGGY
jgi:hypothetical protein